MAVYLLFLALLLLGVPLTLIEGLNRLFSMNIGWTFTTWSGAVLLAIAISLIVLMFGSWED